MQRNTFDSVSSIVCLYGLFFLLKVNFPRAIYHSAMCPTPFESLRCEVSHDIITLMHQSEGSTCEMSLPAFAAAAKKRPVNHTGRV